MTILRCTLEWLGPQERPPLALQVASDLPYVDRNCFEVLRPTIVPARTFLSQLV